MLAQMQAMALRGRGSSATVNIGVTGEQSDLVTDPDDSSVVLRFKADGTLTVTNTAGTTTSSWITGTFVAANYDLYVTVTAGSFTTGTTLTLLPLDTERSFSVVRTSVGLKSCAATYEIQPSGGGTALDTETITLAAEVDA